MAPVHRKYFLTFALLACVPKSARADGGDVTLQTAYAPGITWRRPADNIWQTSGTPAHFNHTLEVAACYGLSHRLSVGIGTRLLWPQTVAAADATFAGKQHVASQARYLQLNFPVTAVLQTDRKRVWNLQLALAAGLQLSHWGHSSYVVQRQGQSWTLPGPNTGWQRTFFYSLQPRITWALSPLFSLAVGPRVSVTQNGSVTMAVTGSVGFSLPAGPSF